MRCSNTSEVYKGGLTKQHNYNRYVYCIHSHYYHNYYSRQHQNNNNNKLISRAIK